MIFAASTMIMWLIPYVPLTSLDLGEMTLLTWDGYESSYSLLDSIYWDTFAAWLVTIFGLWLRLRLARLFFFGLVILAALMIGFGGTRVMTPIDGVLAYANNILIGVMFAFELFGLREGVTPCQHGIIQLVHQRLYVLNGSIPAVQINTRNGRFRPEDNF